MYQITTIVNAIKLFKIKIDIHALAHPGVGEVQVVFFGLVFFFRFLLQKIFQSQKSPNVLSIGKYE